MQVRKKTFATSLLRSSGGWYYNGIFIAITPPQYLQSPMCTTIWIYMVVNITYTQDFFGHRPPGKNNAIKCVLFISLGNWFQILKLSLTKSPFKVTSAEVVIICSEYLPLVHPSHQVPQPQSCRRQCMSRKEDLNKKSEQNPYLVGGFNPSEKYYSIVKLGIFPK